MDEYNHHYHQLILIIIIINWYKYNPLTWMAPLGWLAGFLEYFVSISSRIFPPIISYFDKNFILLLWSLIYIFKHCIIFWSSHRMRRPLKQSSWSLAPGVWCGFKQLQKIKKIEMGLPVIWVQEFANKIKLRLALLSNMVETATLSAFVEFGWFSEKVGHWWWNPYFTSLERLNNVTMVFHHQQ